MAKKSTEFVCQSCDARFPKWTGRCGHCGKWNALAENTATKTSRAGWMESGNQLEALSEIKSDANAERWRTKVFEFDRVVGGGIVKGSFGLLGGTPGVGKSTLILQLLARITLLDKKVLYVSGEESASQIKQRSERLVIRQEGILILIESNLEKILSVMTTQKPDFVVVDSIQPLYTEEITASSGSVSQVRESASLLMQYAKQTETSVMLIGHVTKGGDIAGPRTLEHMVDYVLYLEGEKREQSRLLRTVKNRFGNINEVGLFKMTAKGLAEIKKPNTLFIDKFSSTHPGTAVFAAYEGSRTIFLEVQVLVGDTQQNNPARTTMGMDRNRLNVIIAVLEKHLEMDFSRNDIYVNLAGGFRINEPAIDMAVIAAIISSHLRETLPEKAVYMGEVALTGEFRMIPSVEDRIYESERCNFERIILPNAAVRANKGVPPLSKLVGIRDVRQLLDFIQ